MYILTVEDSFASAHQLQGYKGKCENLHGHNWKVILDVKGDQLDSCGLLIDFNDLKTILKSITDLLDHQNLNDLPYFMDINPSSENIAHFIYDKVSEKLADSGNLHINVDSVTVWESDKSRCRYNP